MGTKDPSLVDINMITVLERVSYLEGTKYFDSVYQKLNFDANYPRIKALLEAMRSIPEVNEVLAPRDAF
jgi:hypothetical protein